MMKMMKITVLDFKQNLNTYSVKRFRKLEKILIDSAIELTTERDFMNANLDCLREVMTVRMSVIEEQLIVLESKKVELKNKLDLMIVKSRKSKGEFTRLQIELENLF